ncbi:MAG: hypothetical protein IJI23_05710 [Lachnospiraceae bacterium]|nr:hypothetical protein [Lachnospiraceae bacterium]
MIASKGSRLYNIDTIKKMAAEGFSDEFLVSLHNMPTYLREMVMSWTTESVAERVREYENGLANTSTIPEGPIIINSESFNDDIEIEQIIEETVSEETIENNDIGKHDYDSQLQRFFSLADDQMDETGTGLGYYDGVNPYKDYSFGSRITVDKLYGTVVSEGYLDKHLHGVVNTQVVIEYGDHKKYGFISKSCDKCKCLFILRDELANIKQITSDRNIEFIYSEVE